MSLNNFFKKFFHKTKKTFDITNTLGHQEMLIDSENKFVNSQTIINVKAKKYYNIIESKFDSFQLMLFNKYELICEKFSDKSESVESRIKIPLKFGLIIIFLLVVFGFGWMAFAKIDGAAVAPGQITFASSKQNIQSIHGGIIKNILVKDGDFVLKGQALIRLEDTDLQANFNSIKNKIYALKITEERLYSEKKNFENFQPSTEILEESSKTNELKEILDSQIRLFNANKNFIETSMQIISQKKSQLKNEIKGLESQLKSLNEQLKINSEELSLAEKLLKNGSITQSRYLSLKSHNSQILGSIGGVNANISKALDQLSEFDIQKLNIMKEIEDNLKNISIELANENEKMIAISESLTKSIIKAPISGNINNLKFKKSGEIIQPGIVIMEIIPENDNLIIEAKLFTKDINQLLRAGFDLIIKI